MSGWLDPKPKRDPTPTDLEAVRERLYDLAVAGRTAGPEASRLLETYKKLAGRDKPRFWP